MSVARFAVVFSVGAAWLLSLDVSAVHAETYTWSVSSGTGAWSVSSNWSPTGLPTSSDTAFVENGGTAAISQSGPVCYILSLGGTGAGVVQMTGGSLAVGGVEYVGDTDSGTFVQSGGTNGTTPALYLGPFAGYSGAYNLPVNSTGVLYATNEYVGSSGTGTFSQSGGTNGTTSLYLSYGASGRGAYTLGGGYLSASGTEAVGYASGGTLTQTGGTNATNWLCLGNASAAPGVYTLGTSSLLSASNGSEYVGYAGSGTLSQSGGTNAIGALYVGGAPRRPDPTRWLGACCPGPAPMSTWAIQGPAR